MCEEDHIVVAIISNNKNKKHFRIAISSTILELKTRYELGYLYDEYKDQAMKNYLPSFLTLGYNDASCDNNDTMRSLNIDDGQIFGYITVI